MELLEQHFDAAFAAPGGIKKLRELILTLAMQGRLAPQDPNDQPASELLKEIEAEKQRLVKEGKIKAPKPLAAIKPKEVPYQLPTGWEWVRLGDVGLIGSSSRVHQRDWRAEGVPFYRAREIVKLSNAGFVENELFISEELYQSLAKGGLIPEANDLMISGVGTIGVPYIVKKTDRFYFKDASVLIFKNIHRLFAPFLFKFFKSPYWVERIHDGSMDTTVHTLTIGRANEILMPLPPILEQHRIVAKIDQLMARCDELEKLRAERERLRLTVHAAALNRVLAYNGETSSDAWRFITRHFGELYAVKPNVAELRKAILQLAVMGKLVPHVPNDPPASELLKEIEAEKQRLVKEGKIKAPKPLPAIKPEEIHYELPQGWEWVRLGDAIFHMDAGWSPKCESEPAKDSEWGVLKTTAVQPLQFWPHENKALPLKLEPRPELQVAENDILITRAGPKNRVGICCVARTVRPRLMLSDKIIRFRIYGELIFADYCALSLNIGHGAEQIERMKSGMADSQMNISQDKVKQVVIPLPPLPEQHRIVAKIDQLMALCDTLERQIEAATVKRTELLNAVVAQV